MSASRNVEARSTVDERAPLLAPEPTQHDTNAPSDAEESTTGPHKVDSSQWTYAWRGVCIVLVILILAVFVKGWIESDNVDVSNPVIPNKLYSG